MPLEPTPSHLYLSRRVFMQRAKQLAAVAAGLSLPFAPAVMALDREYLKQLKQLNCKTNPRHTSEETLTPFNSAIGYNNYYEFSTDKKAVSILAQALDIDNWTLELTGLVANSITLSMEDILGLGIEHRTYRLRCVEGWSMVIPWCGVPLAKIIELAAPSDQAKYVKFTGTHNPAAMIGQRRPTMNWPYTESLRLDEALNPLTIIAVGMYGKSLPKQNGAPLRLVVPWKYGFKSIKAITKIELTETQPITTWMEKAPSEYGYYANVNPNVAHPRWSQRREVRIGETKKHKTLMFNGYEAQVAHMYKGMSLEENF